MTLPEVGFTNPELPKPILATQSSYQEFSKEMSRMESLSPSEVKSMIADVESANNPVAYSENGVGIINISGSLIANKSWIEDFCDVTSYESITEQVNALIEDASVNTIFLNVRSGGGMVHKCFETARGLRDKADISGKKVIAYVDESSCSAAYALSCAAHEVISNPTAETGSIGVLIELWNYAEMMKKEGVERTFITSTDGKVPYAEDGSFREEWLAELQASVSDLYDDFVSHVTSYRDMTAEAVIGTNAGVFSAKDALDLGLIDSVMETEEFYNYLASSTSRNPLSQVVQKVAETSDESNPRMSGETMTTETKASSDLANQMAEMKEMLDAQNAQLASYKAKEARAERETILSDLTASCVGDKKEAVADFLLSDTSEAHKSLLKSVIANAEKSEKALAEACTNKVAEAEEATATAKAETESVKEKFATDQSSIEAELEDVKSAESYLAANVAKMKAKSK